MLGAAVAVAGSAASCDAGKQHDQRTVGPPIEILGVNVGPESPFPFDGAIQIAFDRYLLPATVNRQSFVLLDSANTPLGAEKAPSVVYDPIARTVTLARPSDNWLTEGLTYKLVLTLPEGDSDQGGVRAIDRATLRADQKREFAFRVGPRGTATFEPPVTFCRDVLPIFAAKCNLPTCHGSGGVSAASLVLDSSSGVGLTALNRIAQGANTTGRSTQPAPPGRLFGVDMPIIDPGNPGNSWLLYKVELPRPPVKPSPATYGCTNGLKEPAQAFVFQPLAPNTRLVADDFERSVLSDFILGREMPFPVSTPGGYPDEALTVDEREKIRLWIKGLVPGATLPECRGCGDVSVLDAGTTSDASSADASDASDASDAADAGDAADADDGGGPPP